MTGIDTELLLSRIRDVADYPEPGVMFKDITPLLADPAAFTALTDALAEIAVPHRRHEDRRPGGPRLHPRRPGRRPRRPRLHPRAQGGQAPRSDPQPGVRPGVRLRRDRGARRGPRPPATASWSIDDVLATGGTAEASIQLIRRAGAEVAGLAVLMELGFLGGRARLEPALAGAPLEALLTV